MSTFKGRSGNSVKLLLLFMAALMLSSCATIQKGYHAYLMKGNIIEVSDGEIYLCIGTEDGAAVGQELTVYKITGKSGNIKGAPAGFTRLNTGKVRITEVLDEHFAKAIVISGKAEVTSIVELKRP
jgi:hypothetical protein